MKDFDITIVGGGLVGMAAALALSKYDLKICLLESIAGDDTFHPSYDDRTLVVNKASICFWKNIGVWQKVVEHITPIKKVHVSSKGYFGSVNYDAKKYNLEALAYIVEAKVLGLNLKQSIRAVKNIHIICPAHVVDFKEEKNNITIEYQEDESVNKISSKLMIAADGAQSHIRQKLQLVTHVKSYEKSAIICNITPEMKHDYCAYERLTTTGPTALLPFINNRCGFIWTVEESKLNNILELSDDDFIKQAQTQFGYRLGKFLKVGKRTAYPLYLITVPQQVKSRTLLLGNAAHTMSPVSAQGLNLAIRDIANLADVIECAVKNKRDIGSKQILQNYQKLVNEDQKQTMKYTDDLMSWFKIDNPVVNQFRSLGLCIFDQFSQLKFDLFNKVSGYRKGTAKLLRLK
ncbi:MAG: 2-octaprenyl-6-methoxyphenyl hydroxylase [Marinicellaceae bacterium]